MKFFSNKFKNYAIVAMAAMSLASCRNDDFVSDTDPLRADGMASAPQGIIPGVAPANGSWVVSSITKFFSGYYKPYTGTLAANITLNQGADQKYAPGGRAFNGYYYTLNDTKNGKRGIRKMTVSGSNFSADYTLVTSTKNIQGQVDEVNFTLFDATHGYFTDGEDEDKPYGEIYEFNPTTMQQTRTLDVKDGVEAQLQTVLGQNYSSAYTNASVKRIGTKMLIRRGNYLYADVTFGGSRNQLNQIKQSTNDVYVAVINVSGSEPTVEKVLVGTGATNIGLFNDHPMVNIDPVSHAIYFATVADMDKTYGDTDAGKFSKIFKIADNGDAAPTSITKVVSYADVNNRKEGEFNTMYAYNDVVYTKIAVDPVRYMGTEGHGVNYRRAIWRYAKISSGGNVQFIKNGDAIVMDNFYGFQQPQLINNEIYFISNSDAGSKVYKLAPGSTEATLVTTGTPGGLGWGWANPDKISSIVKL